MQQLKHSFFIVFLLTFNTVLFSQQRGNKQNLLQQQGQNTQVKQAKINPENMVRIIIYDSNEVVKKLKIKTNQLKIVISKSISKHNNKINELKVFNYETFNLVKTFLKQKREEARLSRDFSIMKEAQMKANKMLATIRMEVKKEKMILNAKLKDKLTEKEYKKWLKYQQGELKKLNPKSPNRSQMQSGQRSKGGGQRKGMGNRNH